MMASLLRPIQDRYLRAQAFLIGFVRFLFHFSKGSLLRESYWFVPVKSRILPWSFVSLNLVKQFGSNGSDIWLWMPYSSRSVWSANRRKSPFSRRLYDLQIVGQLWRQCPKSCRARIGLDNSFFRDGRDRGRHLKTAATLSWARSACCLISFLTSLSFCLCKISVFIERSVSLRFN